jgi:MYXO-CTERM domain-containing protein
VWLPNGIEDEIAGIVDGIKSVHPNEPIDALDVKVLNTYSDWAYPMACRSHSCWGDFVQDPVKTLSTRRLDYSTPFPIALHHVLAAWTPDDGSVRWVNMAAPGYVAVFTGINAYGTLASLHDYNSSVSTNGGLVARSVAIRAILTGVASPAIADHRSWAQGELSTMNVATSTFLNYFVPEGQGGVFTCPSGGPCGELRTPQADYFGGQVLITTNSQTDGHSLPGGGDFMDAYYQAGGVKTLQSHFDLMGRSGLHLVSVAVRGIEDMTIWAHGRGRDDLIQIEWATLFPDGTVGGGSSSSGTGGASGSSDADDGTTSCSCRSTGRPSPTPWLWLGLALLLMRRRRQGVN